MWLRRAVIREAPLALLRLLLLDLITAQVIAIEVGLREWELSGGRGDHARLLVVRVSMPVVRKHFAFNCRCMVHLLVIVVDVCGGMRRQDPMVMEIIKLCLS